MHKPAGEDGTFTLDFVDVGHDGAANARAYASPDNSGGVGGEGRYHHGVQDAEDDALDGIARGQTEFVNQPLREKTSEEDLFA